MATQQKFYFLDSATTVTGTLPSNSPAAVTGAAVTGDATGAATNRATSATPGSANPDTESSITSIANTSFQAWGHRRFVSPPLAAQTFSTTDGAWTFSFAATEANAAHNAQFHCIAYAWRPSTGARVGGVNDDAGIGPSPEPGTTQTALSFTNSWFIGGSSGSTTIIDGDVLIFDVSVGFTQAMAVAYTDSFAYNGTTEASLTTCASFCNAPVPITLFSGGGGPTDEIIPYAGGGHYWMGALKKKIWKPKLWVPSDNLAVI